jgi:hypothetical protein
VAARVRVAGLTREDRKLAASAMMGGGGEVVKALGGAGERWLHWACSVQSKATSDDYCGVVLRCAGLVAGLAWLLVF